ncbi:predicted protein [Histoplasma capsulatum var. duboisii H88]|uniref:Predicted protein n=1 Tax=Ajellomyces capsulatus (strain H88) TaxID=544711 RepID=F0ULY2_AJEC8|nr:predicted protein [Histoplasma capsulatum var. duboisii H88]
MALAFVFFTSTCISPELSFGPRKPPFEIDGGMSLGDFVKPRTRQRPDLVDFYYQSHGGQEHYCWLPVRVSDEASRHHVSKIGHYRPLPVQRISVPITTGFPVEKWINPLGSEGLVYEGTGMRNRHNKLSQKSRIWLRILFPFGSEQQRFCFELMQAPASFLQTPGIGCYAGFLEYAGIFDALITGDLPEYFSGLLAAQQRSITRINCSRSAQ